MEKQEILKNRKIWLDALRSGDYRQTTQHMRFRSRAKVK